jgi:hypothetical protein
MKLQMQLATQMSDCWGAGQDGDVARDLYVGAQVLGNCVLGKEQ